MNANHPLKKQVCGCLHSTWPGHYMDKDILKRVFAMLVWSGASALGGCSSLQNCVQKLSENESTLVFLPRALLWPTTCLIRYRYTLVFIHLTVIWVLGTFCLHIYAITHMLLVSWTESTSVGPWMVFDSFRHVRCPLGYRCLASSYAYILKHAFRRGAKNNFVEHGGLG